MRPLQIKPNVPITVALVNPEGVFDFEGGFGLYETTTGQSFILPRPAVVLLNTLDPQPGEEIVITKHWSGKRGEKAEWTIALSPSSEKCRAKAEETPSGLSEQLEASIEHERERRRSLGDPTPIRRPSKRAPAPEVQPRLFDRGTGTHGPAPAAALPVLAVGRRLSSSKTPYKVALREIILTVVNVLGDNREQWNDAAKQDIVSTLFIQAARDGCIVFNFPEE
jgi:hypothetical protein